MSPARQPQPSQQQDKPVVLMLSTVNAVLEYLSNRPWREVANLINAIQGGVRDLPTQSPPTKRPDKGLLSEGAAPTEEEPSLLADDADEREPEDEGVGERVGSLEPGDENPPDGAEASSASEPESTPSQKE